MVNKTNSINIEFIDSLWLCINISINAITIICVPKNSIA